MQQREYELINLSPKNASSQKSYPDYEELKKAIQQGIMDYREISRPANNYLADNVAYLCDTIISENVNHQCFLIIMTLTIIQPENHHQTFKLRLIEAVFNMFDSETQSKMASDKKNFTYVAANGGSQGGVAYAGEGSYHFNKGRSIFNYLISEIFKIDNSFILTGITANLSSALTKKDSGKIIIEKIPQWVKNYPMDARLSLASNNMWSSPCKTQPPSFLTNTI